MDGYSNLAFSPPTTMATAAASGSRTARPSMELTNTKETKAWEGLAIGAVTLARTFSTGSHRFCRSGSERTSRSRSRSRSGLPGALRRAFSMRRHPVGRLGGGAADGYWRIHDMDGEDMDDDDTVVEERGEDDEAAAAAAAEEEEVVESKKAERRDGDAAAAAAANAAAAGKEEEAAAECRTNKKKQRRGGIMKACKKLFRL